MALLSAVLVTAFFLPGSSAADTTELTTMVKQIAAIKKPPGNFVAIFKLVFIFVSILVIID